MASETSSSTLTGPLTAWFIPQIASLALSAARVPLSAHPPRPMESIALTQLAIVQIIFAAMLAPLLFRSYASTIAVLLSAAPMLQLAVFLSSSPTSMAASQYLLLANWVVALSLISLSLRERDRAWLTAVATFWSLGGVLLAYLHAEFAPTRGAPDFLYGPAYFAIQIAQHGFAASSWMAVAAIPALALIIAFTSRHIHGSNPSEKGRVEGNGNPPPAPRARRAPFPAPTTTFPPTYPQDLWITHS